MGENGAKKKVDHDEDRSNPQYIPKKGTFYEHDDRTMEDLNKDAAEEVSEASENKNTDGSTAGGVSSVQSQKVTSAKAIKKTKDHDRWSHDRFNEYEQAPKSRAELVSAYGYDIRNEDGPPRSRRPRHYGRNQSKYSRNWEDEEAYRKSQATKPTNRRSLAMEDFPALGATTSSTSKSRGRPKLSPRPKHPEEASRSFSSPERRRDRDKPSREQRSQRYNNDTSNNNNARHVKGKKNINFNHNIEFKNQNRKNINYETTQAKNNNVLNQQLQSGSAHNQMMASSASHHHSSSQNATNNPHQHHQSNSNQRYNNSEPPLPTLSFTNSKMNNATNSASSTAQNSSRGILNYDNSSNSYGRGGAGNQDKDVNNQSAASPDKNMHQQFSDHQMDQMKYMEKNYAQQQNKATNLNLNQHQSINSMSQDGNDVSRSKRYSLRQRSNINEMVATPAQQQQQQQQPQSSSSQHFHPQYHQQEMDSGMVQIPPQQSQTYMSTVIKIV